MELEIIMIILSFTSQGFKNGDCLAEVSVMSSKNEQSFMQVVQIKSFVAVSEKCISQGCFISLVLHGIADQYGSHKSCQAVHSHKHKTIVFYLVSIYPEPVQEVSCIV